MLQILFISVTGKNLTQLLLNPSFAGALLGALLTGMISLILFKLEKRNVTLGQKQHYEKVYIGIKRNLKLVKEYSSTYKNIIVGEQEYLKNELEVLNKMFYLVSLELDKIDIKDIPFNVHVNFTELKDALRTIKLCSEIFMEVKSLAFLEKEFLNDIERFIYNLNEFEKYFDKSLK